MMLEFSGIAASGCFERKIIRHQQQSVFIDILYSQSFAGGQFAALAVQLPAAGCGIPPAGYRIIGSGKGNILYIELAAEKIAHCLTQIVERFNFYDPAGWFVGYFYIVQYRRKGSCQLQLVNLQKIFF